MSALRYILITTLILSTFVYSESSDSKDEIRIQKNLSNKEVIEKILDSKAEEFPEEGVVKVNFPRTDIQVRIQDWPLDPFMGLSSWVAFQRGTKKGIEAMIMGDIVLLEDEVNPIMSLALENGIEITALHNHFFSDKPRIYYMHINGEGKTEDLAQTIKKMFDAIRTIPQKIGLSTKIFPLPVKNSITAELLEKILNIKGQTKNGIFKIVVGRETRAGCGCIIGKNMGINTWAAFSGTDDNAIVDGDFAVLENELQDVLKALKSANIDVVAIHNHMINEHPRFIFVHYFGRGTAVNLALGLKHALGKTNSKSI